MGRFSAGQACAVGLNVALSAAHIADPEPFKSEVPLVPVMWSDDVGSRGRLFPVFVDAYRDLAVYTSDVGFTDFAVPSDQAPEPGDLLRIVGYDWRSKPKAWAKRVLDAVVLRVVAGHVIMDTRAEAGSSGSCILDSQGRVVGIMIGGTVITRTSSGVPVDVVGVGVGVWGNLFPEIEEKKKDEE
jgi:hypothetical protein